MENLNSVIYFVASLCGAIFLSEPQWLDDPAAEYCVLTVSISALLYDLLSNTFCKF